MAEPMRVLRPVVETEEEDAVSAVSASSSRRNNVSPLKEHSPTSIFRRNGYHRMPSDGVQEMADLSKSGREAETNVPFHSTSSQAPQAPSEGISGLGIASWNVPINEFRGEYDGNIRVNVHTIQRKPVAVRGSPPDTPRSHHGLLGSASSSPAITPMMGSMNAGLPPRTSSHHTFPIRNQPSWDGTNPSVAGSHHRSQSRDSDAPRNLLNMSKGTAAAHDTTRHSDPGGELLDDEFDDDVFYKGFGQPPSYCGSKKDIHASRGSWLSITIFILSLYSTVMSGIWLVAAIIQPRWGYGISSRQGLNPSTATTLSALISKTIEMSFVTVFISCLGQILTRRSFVRNSRGMTLGEMTMRNWVIQPGSLITHAESVPKAGITILGALALTATVAAAFYTTASDSMVAPKLKYGSWEHRELSGHIRSQYANAEFVGDICATPLGVKDEAHASESCTNVQFSGQSYRNLLNFMSAWTNIAKNGSVSLQDLSERPTGTTLLFDNTTMESTWIERHASNVEASFERHGRIINNVTLAMPHPGVYAAATSKVNKILQPDDLAGVGEYSIRAGVVSPSINVMCVNMDQDELEPLVYTEWPDSKTDRTGVGKQTSGSEGWEDDVPTYFDRNGEDEFLNRTKVDNIFRWGPGYGRRPPVFQLFPADYNLITNSSVYQTDSIYMVAKITGKEQYSLCELKSWLSPNCSTLFDISGTAGARMIAHCEDGDDEDSYLRSFPPNSEWPMPEFNWKWLAEAWRLSMDLNGGVYNNNASNARIISQLALQEPKLPRTLPSMAEALAVYASSTLVIGSINTPFKHYWDYEEPILSDPGPLQAFNASIRTQQYTSGHVSDWQSVFYVVLILVFAINLFCLVYFILRSGLVTDFTEPQNLFALAVNSPPSVQLKGSCGGGPEKRDLMVPWRVAYAPSANHYFFEEANPSPWTGVRAEASVTTSREHGRPKGASYKRLSSGKSWI